MMRFPAVLHTMLLMAIVGFGAFSFAMSLLSSMGALAWVSDLFAIVFCFFAQYFLFSDRWNSLK